MSSETEANYRPRRTRTRNCNFRRLFRRQSGSAFEQGLARLSVLLEDLRLESHGVALEPGAVPTIEEAGSNYRMLYFMRRTTGTLVEVQDALHRLTREPEFRSIESRAQERGEYDYRNRWQPAIEFFTLHNVILKTIRNDVGGHFGKKAAAKAFAAISDDYMASIELQVDSEDRVRAILPFAAEISGAALLAHVPGDGGVERTKALNTLLGEGVQHAIAAVYFLVGAALWERMG